MIDRTGLPQGRRRGIYTDLAGGEPTGIVHTEDDGCTPIPTAGSPLPRSLTPFPPSAAPTNLTRPAFDDLNSLTCNEIQHLFMALVVQPLSNAAHRLSWFW